MVYLALDFHSSMLLSCQNVLECKCQGPIAGSVYLFGLLCPALQQAHHNMDQSSVAGISWDTPGFCAIAQEAQLQLVQRVEKWLRNAPFTGNKHIKGVDGGPKAGSSVPKALWGRRPKGHQRADDCQMPLKAATVVSAVANLNP